MVQVVRLLYPVGFQHTAAQRQLVGDKYGIDPDMLVSRHSRLKAADGFIMLTFVMVAVSTHSCTKAAEYIAKHIDSRLPVSTHSRLKAAAVWIAQYYPIVMFQHTAARRRLDFHAFFLVRIKRFQHTAARRRLVLLNVYYNPDIGVSTHSRPKAAGWLNGTVTLRHAVSTHSRPKAAGFQAISTKHAYLVSTHSRPKAAGLFFVVHLYL